jgi:hypothetical protein
MAKVYRIEHFERKSHYNDNIGQGCYVDAPIDAEWYEEMKDKHANTDTHPNIHFDELSVLTRLGYFCCFATLTDLENWFEGYLDLLAEEGFVIHEYEIEGEPEHGSSMKQAMFDPNKIISRKKFEKDLVD